MKLPFCAAADRNKEAIGDALAGQLANTSSVLEIGSGSGQHAIYLCARFSHLQWQPTEQQHNIAGLRAAVDQSNCENINLPFEMEVSSYTPADHRIYCLVYSANTAHIMGIEEVRAMFRLASRSLATDGLFALYGPFKENGHHNSDGNIAFDNALQSEDSKMGIRDIGELAAIAESHDLALQKQIAMPSNNRILLWYKL